MDCVIGFFCAVIGNQLCAVGAIDDGVSWDLFICCTGNLQWNHENVQKASYLPGKNRYIFFVRRVAVFSDDEAVFFRKYG